MITLRYHLVSLVAVLFALAVGIVLGAGWLSETQGPIPTTTSAAADSAELEFEQAFADEAAPTLLSKKLDGRSVAFLALPNARDEQVSGLITNARNAGATITAQGRLTERLIDPSNRQFAEQVADEAAPDDLFESGADSYAKVGGAIASIFLGDAGAEIDDPAEAMSNAMSQAELVTWSTEPSTFADLVVIVTGPGDGENSAPLLREMSATFADAGDGVVVAGPQQAGRPQGFIGSLRDADIEGDVSTVDVTDSAAGRIVTILALAATADGKPGSWGTEESADGALPSP